MSLYHYPKLVISLSSCIDGAIQHPADNPLPVRQWVSVNALDVTTASPLKSVIVSDPLASEVKFYVTC